MSAIESSATAGADSSPRHRGPGSQAPAFAAARLRLIYGLWPTYRTDVLLVGALSLFAAFLRTYNLELMGWVPDTYDRLADASRVAEGHFPQSPFYLPAMSLLLAPVATLFPNSLFAVQILVIMSGIAMVPLGYITMFRLTRTRRDAVIFGFVMALLPAYVHFSRDGVFDMINTLLVVSAVLLLRPIARQHAFWCLAYAVLLAFVFTFRATNIFLAPILMLYYLTITRSRDDHRHIWRGLLTYQSVGIGIVTGTLVVMLIVPGSWKDNVAATHLTVEGYIRNIRVYENIITLGPIGAFFIVPLAVAGAWRLYRLNHSLLVATVGLIAVWPIVHAPLSFTAYRYMLPVFFFVFLLVVLGFGQLHLVQKRRALAGRILATPYLMLSFIVLGLFVSMGTARVIGNWHTRAAQSDEGLFREFRPVIGQLEPGSLLVSAVTRGFERSDNVHFLDLVDFWRLNGKPPAGLAKLDSIVERHLDSGGKAFYLFSRFESGSDFQGGGRDSFALYFQGLGGKYRFTPIYRSSAKSLAQDYWILYRIERPVNSPDHQAGIITDGKTFE